MSDEPSSEPSPANLEIDLALSFQPAWVKEVSTPEKISHLADRYEERPERSGQRRDDRGGPRSNRGPGRGGEKGRPPRRDDRRGGRRDDRRDDRREAPRPERQAPPLNGWDLQFVPEPRGVEGLARQIKASAITYPLFDLAHLVLEKPERYRVRLDRTTGPALFQLVADGSIWLSEREAITHAVTRQLEKFYRRERVTGDPPKGSYLCVALCGMSDTLLGPPNYHDYQDKLRKLHAARFSHLPFEAYKSRVRMVRDEEVIQKWKDEQSTKDEYYPLESPEGTDPVKLLTPAELEQHFRENHAATGIVSLGDRVVLPGPALMQASSQPVKLLARQALDDLRRFPLPLAHTLGHGLASKGLQIFKAHKNITYVSVARPHYLDRVTTPVSEGLSAILEYLEAHPSVSRADCRKALAALRTVPAGEEAAPDNAVVRDLSWLLHEGYIVDYARRGLEAVGRSEGRPPVKKKQPRRPEREGEPPKKP
jgi:hypothetical protein